MKNQFSLLILVILSINCYSQIVFEKGYYIDNANQKIDCLIKNMGWKNNPTDFIYKFSENDEPTTINIKAVKEFGFYNNYLKFIRQTVNIDRSSDKISNLSRERIPALKEEQLFLQVLLEGKASLYRYIDGTLTRFFYKVDTDQIDQLIYKRFKKPPYYKDIDVNNRFRQQLYTSLKCNNIQKEDAEQLVYKRKDLINFFEKYNQCSNANFKNYWRNKEKGDLFNLTIRPRMNTSSMTLENNFFATEGINFDKTLSFTFGIEAEIIFPFHRYKWAVFAEPTYQNYSGEKTLMLTNVVGGQLTFDLDYQSIELPFGVRHYFFLNDKSNIFINILHVFNINTKSSVELIRADNSVLNNLELEFRNSYGFGIGYKHNNKYSLELRYRTNRELSNLSTWKSEYQSFSIILGYSVF